MPPLLALLLCGAFVLVLLAVENRESRGVSAAMWIPTVWMLISASRPLATWFVAPGNVTGGNEAGSPIDRWVLLTLGGAAVLVLSRRKSNWWKSLRRHKWLLALLAYMFLSTFWSDITLIALKRWLREVIVVVMALVILSEVNPRQALASLLRRCAYVLIPFSLMLIKYYPLLGRQYGRYSGIEMWTGVTDQKNQLGRLCMVSAFFLFWALYQLWRKRHVAVGRHQKWTDVSIIAMAVYLLIGSDSATSLASLVFCITTFVGLRWMKKVRLRVPLTGLLGLAIFLIGFGASTPFLGGANVATFSSSLGRDSTLTGRTEVWAAVLPAIKKHPLIGYGFGSFWTDARRELYEIPTAHNGYLDVLLELGACGLAFCTAWLLSCAVQLRRALKESYDWASFALCLLLISLIYNCTESAVNSLTEYITAVVLFLSLAVTARVDVRAKSALPLCSTLKEPSRLAEEQALAGSW